ncbi:putative hydrolase with phophatase-like domain [Klebsiella pneumoniae]|uniref:Putative hydrolase with phophatase-like domain n=1 Tax=Klebsiella pneumoniae TaxID=573 RepID=A0A2X3GJ68_KLEPN|nr:putative hydrolase with phophatase-like domain [Klebsiella pneumoniae]
MHFDIAWQEVDTVLLDMDGTLLDLAFDNYFWQTLVPETWGAARGLNLQEAKEAMAPGVSRRAAYAKLVLSGLLERAPGFGYLCDDQRTRSARHAARGYRAVP